MLIRPASPDDDAAIAALILPEIAAGETYALSRDMGATAAVAYWRGPDRQTFVVEDNGRLIGSYFLRANQGGGGDHIANAGYMVDPAARGRGVARAMATDSFDRARAAGFIAMQFNFVVSSNQRAVALWQTLGFAIVGRLPGAFRHPALGPVDVLVMFRSL